MNPCIETGIVKLLAAFRECVPKMAALGSLSAHRLHMPPFPLSTGENFAYMSINVAVLQM